MIVLDATNKTLQIKRLAVSTQSFSSVVSYWSIDTSNVWTPGSFEAGTPPSGDTSIIILPAPAAGETRVVENAWIRMISTANSGDMEIFMDVGGVHHDLAVISNIYNFMFTLGRNGTFTRQESVFLTGTATRTVNAH